MVSIWCGRAPLRSPGRIRLMPLAFQAHSLHLSRTTFTEDIMRIATIERLAKGIASGSMTDLEALAAASDLRSRLLAAINRSKALTDFMPVTTDAAPLIGEDKHAFAEFSYKFAFTKRFASEVTFRLEQGTVRAFVRTLELLDGRGAESEVFTVAGGGLYNDEVKSFCMEALAKSSVQRATEHRVLLLEDLGFSLNRMTVKRLHRASGRLVLQACP